jgi:hypothetical protein
MMHINSPRTDDDAIEQEIRSKGLNSPRITPKDVEAVIAHETYSATPRLSKPSRALGRSGTTPWRRSA